MSMCVILMLTCALGTHLAFCQLNACINNFKCPHSYCLPLHKVCNGQPDCINGEDEHNCAFNMSCPGLLKCRAGWCVHPKYFCDGNIHCGAEAEDELVCTAIYCPVNCSCMSATVICTKTKTDTDSCGEPLPTC